MVEKEIKTTKIDPFLLMWGICMASALLSGFIRGGIDAESQLGFVRAIFLCFGIIAFIIGWIIGIIGLIFFIVIKAKEKDIGQDL